MKIPVWAKFITGSMLRMILLLVIPDSEMISEENLNQIVTSGTVVGVFIWEIIHQMISSRQATRQSPAAKPLTISSPIHTDKK